MTEEWKDIPGYPYQASSLGNIRRTPGTGKFKSKLLKQVLTQRYLMTRTYTNENIATSSRVHRLVCLAFHGFPREEQTICRHLNDDIYDNRPENLAWGTAKDNAADAIRNKKQRRAENHPNAKTTKEIVDKVRQDYQEHMKNRNKAENGFLVTLQHKYKLSRKQITGSVYDPNYYRGYDE